MNLNRVGETGTGSTHHGAAHPRTPWRVRRLSCSALYRHPERHGRPCRRPTFRGALASQIISDARRTRNAQVCERLGGATATAPRLQRPGRSGKSLATADRGPAVVRSARAVRPASAAPGTNAASAASTAPTAARRRSHPSVRPITTISSRSNEPFRSHDVSLARFLPTPHPQRRRERSDHPDRFRICAWSRSGFPRVRSRTDLSTRSPPRSTSWSQRGSIRAAHFRRRSGGAARWANVGPT